MIYPYVQNIYKISLSYIYTKGTVLLKYLKIYLDICRSESNFVELSK